MMRRRRRYTPEGEEGLGTKILVVIGFIVVALIIGGIGYVYLSKKQEIASLDPETFCPKNGPVSVTSVLIDRTDGINEAQAENLKTFVNRWANDIPKHGAFHIYEVGGNGLPRPVVAVCNPGAVDDLTGLTENERRARERYEEKFRKPVEKLLDEMLTEEESETSPIMEAVQAIGVRDFASVRAAADEAGVPADMQLIIVSDLLQHTAEFSLYKTGPDLMSFRKSGYGRKVESDLRGVKAWIYLMQSSSGKQTDDVGQFWLDWLMLQGADLKGQLKVAG